MEKIEKSLIELGKLALSNGIILPGRELENWIKIRNSLINKLKFLDISSKLLLDSFNEYAEKISKLDPKENRIIYDLGIEASLLQTYHLECLIYNLLSSLDNLKSLIPFFYKDLSNTTKTMRRMYLSVLNQEKMLNKELRKFVESEGNYWLVDPKKNKGLYEYRAKIYHWLSNLCGVEIPLSVSSKDFVYELNIILPSELSLIMNCKEKCNVTEFSNLLKSKYENYILNLIDVIKKDIN